MDLEKSQFDGQSEALSKFQDAVKKRKEELTKAHGPDFEGEYPSYNGFIRASKAAYKASSSVSTDDLVKHVNTREDGDDDDGALSELKRRTDLTPEHISQMVMSPLPDLSHSVIRKVPQATDAHRALHHLLHPQCLKCRVEKRTPNTKFL